MLKRSASVRLALLAAAPVLVLAACGGASTSSPSPAGSSSGTSATASPSAGTSASATSSGSGDSAAGAAVTLTTSQLPSGSETWTQIDDGTLGNGSIHKRVWKNANQSQGIEIDLIVEPSSAAATSDWARWDSTIKGKVQSAQTATCPGQLGSSCTELIGTTSDGKHQGTIDWQKGAALIVVFYVNANSSVDQSYLEQIATAQDTNIPTS